MRCVERYGFHWSFTVFDNDRYDHVALSPAANSEEFEAPEMLRSLLGLESVVGRRAKFQCKVSGYPTPMVTWYKDHKRIKPSDKYTIGTVRLLARLLIPASLRLLGRLDFVVRSLIFCSLLFCHFVLFSLFFLMGQLLCLK